MSRTLSIPGYLLLLSFLIVSCAPQPAETPLVLDASESTAPQEMTEEVEDEPPVKSERMVDFDLGSDKGCGVMESGSLWCWGLLFQDQDGISPFAYSYTPVFRQVQGVNDARAVVISGPRVCVLHGDDSVSCFTEAPSLEAKLETVDKRGLEGLYTLAGASGFAGPAAPNDFSEIPGLEGATVLAGDVGPYHGCAALDDGSVWCWGEGSFGNLGTGRSVKERLVAAEVPGMTDAVVVRVEGDSSCALDSEGMISCWGEYTPAMPVVAGMPYTIPSLNALGIQQVDFGDGFACVLDESSSVWCWGVGPDLFPVNSREQAQDAVDLPKRIPGLSNVTSLVVDYKTACALTAGGGVKCWGGGILGDGREPDGVLWRGPATVAGVSSAVSLSANYNQWCAVLSNGTAKCWGDLFHFGALPKAPGSPPSDVYEHLLPATIDVGTPIAQVVAGGRFLTESGSMLYLNDGEVTPWEPAQNSPKADQVWSENTGGFCLKQKNGTGVFCNNSAGLRGDGTDGNYYDGIDSVRELDGAIEIAFLEIVNHEYACAILGDSSTWCWGKSPLGTAQPLENLLDRDPTDSPDFYPANRVNIPPAQDIALSVTRSGTGGACAVSTDSELWCWGRPGPNYKWFAPIKFQTSWDVDNTAR